MSVLQSSQDQLGRRHDLVMFDLDGVVYVSGHAVEHAAEVIGQLRSDGVDLAFVTNNAARAAAMVADHLQELGIDAGPDDVATSAQAVAGLLRHEFGEDAPILVLGGEGLHAALREAGLRPLLPSEETEPRAVVTGYGPEVVWRDLMRTAVRIADGLPWYASNTDLSIPTEYGVAPGHGVQVRMLQQFCQVDPVVAGKPSPPLLRTTIDRWEASTPLMVGDRLDTDIEGAHAVDVPSLLVLTGVTGLAELVTAGDRLRPTYLHTDLRGLVEPHPEVEVEGSTAVCGGWRAEVTAGRLEVDGQGSASDWWRAVAVAGWRHLDETGDPAEVSGLQPPAADDQ